MLHLACNHPIMLHRVVTRGTSYLNRGPHPGYHILAVNKKQNMLPVLIQGQKSSAIYVQAALEAWIRDVTTNPQTTRADWLVHSHHALTACKARCCRVMGMANGAAGAVAAAGTAAACWLRMGAKKSCCSASAQVMRSW